VLQRKCIQTPLEQMREKRLAAPGAVNVHTLAQPGRQPEPLFLLAAVREQSEEVAHTYWLMVTFGGAGPVRPSGRTEARGHLRTLYGPTAASQQDLAGANASGSWQVCSSQVLATASAERPPSSSSQGYRPGGRPVLHARNARAQEDLSAVPGGKQPSVVIGDLRSIAQTRSAADQVNRLGCFGDAGIESGTRAL